MTGFGPAVPAVVSLHLVGVRHARDGVARMALDRGRVRALPGCTFAKLLGTGSGRTFTPRDADPHHWGVLACWSDDDGPARFEASRSWGRWQEVSYEQARFLLRPLASRGTWSSVEPFGRPGPARWEGAVAAVTRARLRVGRWRRFQAAVPPVVAALRAADGLRLAIGVGEAPVGLQGTFSVWRSAADLVAFAHRGAPHREVVVRTPRAGWYAEDLFARFAVLDATGRLHGADVATPVPGGPVP